MEQHWQNPRGRHLPGLFKESQRGWECSWHRNGGERWEAKSGRKGPAGHYWELTFTPREQRIWDSTGKSCDLLEPLWLWVHANCRGWWQPGEREESQSTRSPQTRGVVVAVVTRSYILKQLKVHPMGVPF